MTREHICTLILYPPHCPGIELGVDFLVKIAILGTFLTLYDLTTKLKSQTLCVKYILLGNKLKIRSRKILG